MTTDAAKMAQTNEDERIPGGVVLRPVEGVIEHDIDQDVVLYHPGRDMAHVLNETAAIVWWLCDGQRSVGQVVSAIAELYAVQPEIIAADVDEILTDFMLSGLVQ